MYSHCFYEPRIAFIFVHCVLYFSCYAALEIFVDHEIVVPGSEDIEVEVFVDDLYVTAAHLHHRQTYNFVVGRSEPVTVLVLEVGLFDLQVEVDPERS